MGGAVDPRQVELHKHAKSIPVAGLSPEDQRPFIYLSFTTHYGCFLFNGPRQLLRPAPSARLLHSPYAHATISAVRTFLGIAVRYILWFTALCVITALVVVAHAYVTGYDPLRATTPETIIQLLAHGAAQVVFGCALLAAVISLFSVLKRAQRPIVSVLVIGVLTALSLVAAGLLDSEATAPPTARALRDRTIVRVGQIRVYAMNREGISYQPLVTHDPEMIPGFRVHPEGIVDPETGDLVIPASAMTIPITNSDDSYPALVRPPDLLTRALADLNAVAKVVSIGNDSSAPITIAALSFLVISLWTLVRLTRWPLFNAAAAVLTLRFAVWLIASIRSGPLTELAVSATGSSSLPYAAAAIVAGIAVILCAASILLPPFRTWKGEVDNG